MQKPPSYDDAMREKNGEYTPPPSYYEVVRPDSPEPQPPIIALSADRKQSDPFDVPLVEVPLVIAPQQEDMPPPIPAPFHEQQLDLKINVDQLLTLVAAGKQMEVEQLIASAPEILLLSGDVTDGAGRTFRHITALQYAVWALDAHMWTMMLPLFPDAALINGSSVAHQLQALEEKGLGEHGSHFDFKPLLYNYAAFVAEPSKETWCRGVGGAQRLLPDHVIQEYTTPDRPFSPVPDFSVHCGRPDVHGARGVLWMRTATYGGGRIGRSWAAARGGEWCAYGSPTHSRSGPARSDQHALRALCLQRRQDLSDLLDRFDIVPALDIDPPQAPESKSPGRR